MIGLIGGLGPLAGAHVYHRLVLGTRAVGDLDQPSVILLSRPFPSRIAHAAGKGPSPLPELSLAGKTLRELGCTTIALASATTHIYLEDLRMATEAPFVNGVDQLCRRTRALAPAAVLMLCTSACRNAGLYERWWPSGVELRYPSATLQNTIDGIIDDVKRLDTGVSIRERLRCIVDQAMRLNLLCALGCTELSVLWDYSSTQQIIDISDSIAHAALEAASKAIDPPS